MRKFASVASLFLAVSVMAADANLKQETVVIDTIDSGDVTQDGFISRELNGIYSVTSCVDVVVSGDSLTDLLVCIPYPEDNMYQDIIWQNDLDLDMIATFPETGQKFIRYAKYQACQPSKCIRREFIFKCWSVKANLDMVKTVFPYDQSTSTYKIYTRKPAGAEDNLQINPSNSWIIARRDEIISKTGCNYLEYAREAYRLVASQFSYRIDEPNLETIIENKGGQCGGLTAVVVSLLRSNGIPSRTLVCKRPSGSNHVWGEFYLQNYGWIPFDVTADLGKTDRYKYFGFYDDTCIICTVDMHQTVVSEAGRKKDVKLLQSYSWWYWYSGEKVSVSVNHVFEGSKGVSAIPLLSSTATPDEVAVVLEDSADEKLRKNISDVKTYTSFRAWALGINGVTPEQVKASPNAWLSYALDTSALIAELPTERDLKICGFTQNSSTKGFDLSFLISGVAVGENVIVANLERVFSIEGAKILGDSEFRSDNVGIEFGKIEDGKVKVRVIPKDLTERYFFVRVKMKK